MKYLVILGDGMADCRPLDWSKSPLNIAYHPFMDYLATYGTVGLVNTLQGVRSPVGSDVANLNILGFDLRKCYRGRASLEMMALGVELEPDDIALRINLVNIKNNVMVNPAVNDISQRDARKIIDTLNDRFGNERYHFYCGSGYRHYLVIHHENVSVKKDGHTYVMHLTPPHNIIGKEINDYLPTGHLDNELCGLMSRAERVISSLTLNKKRVEKGLPAITGIWLWGESLPATLTSFREMHHLEGAIISAVDLLKGIAIGSGMRAINVKGATGTLNTNYEGKANAAIKCFKHGVEFVYVHIEAPDECSHQRDEKGKVKAIELIDEKILAPIFNYLYDSGEEFKVLVMPDHATSSIFGGHTGDAVPYVLYSNTNLVKGIGKYSEESARKTGPAIAIGELMNKFLYR